jgi:hypothetical protein
MSRFVLIYVGCAAFLTAWSITEAQYRVTHTGYLFAPDPYLPLLRGGAFALWIITVLAVVARENRNAAAANQAAQTQQIENTNRKLVDAVRTLTEAVLSDVDQRKRAEITSLLAEYGIDTDEKGRARIDEFDPYSQDTLPLNLIEFRRHRSSGDG